MCCDLPDVRGRHVVLGVTGGIAVYKSCEIVSRLRKLGVETHVIMTKNAAQFVQPLTFETLSNHPVVTDTFARPETWEVEHIALAKRADVFAIAPATANIMAKMACGIADDMLSTTVLATKAPILLAPAMNTGMWTAAVTQQNVQTLKARGVHFAGPEAGFLACGDTGAGRMSEPETIVRAIVSLLCPKRDFAGLRVLVTAGATRERLDPVRYMTNDSSGKMGFALAEAARNRGAQVTVIAGSTTAPVPDGIDIRRVESTRDLFDDCARHGRCDSSGGSGGLPLRCDVPTEAQEGARRAAACRRTGGEPGYCRGGRCGEKAGAGACRLRGGNGEPAPKRASEAGKQAS